MRDKGNETYVFVATVLFCILGVSRSASAYIVPTTCQDSFNVRAYDLGLEKGRILIEEKWEKIGQDCVSMAAEPEFKNAVIDVVSDLTLPPDSIDFVICHYYGYMNGIADHLKEIEAACPNQCLMDGEFVGEIAAKMYCELSIGFDGLQSTDFVNSIMSVCSQAMTDICSTSFESLTSDYSNVFSIQCQPYTQNSYELIWQTTGQNQCIFIP